MELPQSLQQQNESPRIGARVTDVKEGIDARNLRVGAERGVMPVREWYT